MGVLHFAVNQVACLGFRTPQLSCDFVEVSKLLSGIALCTFRGVQPLLGVSDLAHITERRAFGESWKVAELRFGLRAPTPVG